MIPPEQVLSALTDRTPDAPARRVVVGFNWTMVEGPDGCGFAHTPPRSAPGCRTLPEAGTLAGRPLRELAATAGGPNPLAAAVGLAAINAARSRYDLPADAGNGLAAFADVAARTVVVGRFPGLERHLPGCTVVERDPGPGDRPEAETEALVARAEAVVITAQTLVNGSFAALMRMAAGRRVALVGPGVPLDPMLFDAGVEVLGGLVATDPDAAARLVAEGCDARGLKAAARNATMAAPRS
jgi:uncharacterized protein (DUF4213/DUF364 family)